MVIKSFIKIGGVRQRVNKVASLSYDNNNRRYRKNSWKNPVVYVDVTAVFGTDIKHCTDCGFPTRHDQTANGEWVCWCGSVFVDETEAEKELQWLEGVEHDVR